MGVRGLETYLENNCHQACYKVNIAELIKQHKKINKSAPVIVIDGRAILRQLYKKEVKSWIHGGQLKKYAEALKKLISTLQDIGAELMFIFDGSSISPLCYNVWKDKCENNESERLFSIVDNGADLENQENESFLVPHNLRIVTVYLAKSMGCKVLTSAMSNVAHIALYAHRNSCFAILAQDSDYVIREGASYYLSLKHLDIEQVTTLNYDRHKLAEYLKISTSHLPLLASLLGNNIINKSYLKEFHRHMLRGARYDYRILIFKIALFIKNHSFENGFNYEIIKKMTSIVFPYNENEHKLLYDSILFYEEGSEDSVNCELIRSASDSNWREILKKVLELLVSTVISNDVAYVIFNQTWENHFHIEDCLKIVDTSVSEIMKPLHEKLYGILLYEKPEECKVEERYVSGHLSLYCVKPVKPQGNHPGLIALWDGDVENKWQLIGYVFNISADRIRSLPPHLVVPGLTFKYLNSALKIENWEMDALISSACLLREYNVESLMAMQKPTATTRSVYLYGLVTTTYRTVISVFNGVGDPLPMEEIVPLNYQDGHLFNLKYWQASRNCDISELCDKKDLVINTFTQLKSFITSEL